MRSHGVPGWPDPNSQGLFNKDQVEQIPDGPQLDQAEASCANAQPAGHYFQVDPAQLREITAEGLKFAACMRTHRIPNFPDPDQAHLQNGGLGFVLVGIDPHAPRFQAAREACRHVLTGSGG